MESSIAAFLMWWLACEPPPTFHITSTHFICEQGHASTAGYHRTQMRAHRRERHCCDAHPSFDELEGNACTKLFGFPSGTIR